MSKKRKSGSGTVRLRKDGRWEGRHVIGYDEKGLPKTKSVLGKTKKECIDKLKSLQSQLVVTDNSTLKPTMAFGAWVLFWYEHYAQPQLRPTTRAEYENRIYQHIVPEIGKIPLNQLTQQDLHQFYHDLKKGGRKRMADHYGAGLSDRMVRGCHTTCNSALTVAVEQKLILSNPATNCKVPTAKSAEMQILTVEELQRFLIQAKYEGYFPLFLLAISTGLRRGELLALQWGDLDFATGQLQICKQVQRTEGQLTVSQPKTKAGNRTLILPKTVQEVLKAHAQTVHSTWMFPSSVCENKPLDPASCRRKLQQILEKANCKRVRFHDLRHTFATNAIASGMDVKTLSTIIGHVSVATTLDIYTHSTHAMEQAAANAIDQGICGAPPVITPKESQTQNRPPQKFEPNKGTRRKPGTGCISQINDHLWEGRYSMRQPDGSRKSKNIYSKTEAECEEKLAVLIGEMKAKVASL